MKLFNLIKSAYRSLGLNWIISLENLIMYSVVMNLIFNFTEGINPLTYSIGAIILIYVLICMVINNYKSLKN